ncbi:MAG TPA: hypothetical protein PKC87_02415 [Candidatus Absconditabacterales bacterium]|nr:hypothetical protein [Candidatus Absconditabacterales bacterium]
MKKSILFISLGLLIIMVSGCGKPSLNTINQDVSNTTTKNECMLGCTMMWTSNDGNKDRSTADMNKDCNNLCNATQGMQNNDTSACEKAEGMLRDTCYSDIAKKTKDATLCENISEVLFISACYSTVAEETKNPLLCDKIPDQMLKDVCLENFK